MESSLGPRFNNVAGSIALSLSFRVVGRRHQAGVLLTSNSVVDLTVLV